MTPTSLHPLYDFFTPRYFRYLDILYLENLRCIIRWRWTRVIWGCEIFANPFKQYKKWSSPARIWLTGVGNRWKELMIFSINSSVQWQAWCRFCRYSLRTRQRCRWSLTLTVAVFSKMDDFAENLLWNNDDNNLCTMRFEKEIFEFSDGQSKYDVPKKVINCSIMRYHILDDLRYMRNFCLPVPFPLCGRHGTLSWLIRWRFAKLRAFLFSIFEMNDIFCDAYILFLSLQILTRILCCQDWISGFEYFNFLL